MSDSFRFQIHHLEPRILSEKINTKSFDCGDADLNEFLQDDALNYQKQNLAQTTCIFFDGYLIGYYSLACDSLSLEKNEIKKAVSHKKTFIKSYPAIKIARMAFAKEHHSKGLGSLVVEIVKGMAISLKDEKGLACKYITVDAYPVRLGFYEKCGFVKNQAQPRQAAISMRHHIYN